jgi:hypothetical protein
VEVGESLIFQRNSIVRLKSESNKNPAEAGGRFISKNVTEAGGRFISDVGLFLIYTCYNPEFGPKMLFPHECQYATWQLVGNVEISLRIY